MRNQVVVYVQYMVVKYNFLAQLKDVQKIYVGYFSLVHVCYEQEVGREANEPIYVLSKTLCELLTIDGNPVDEGLFIYF